MKFEEALSIKFNTEMVRAILAGNKTQTRRPVKGLEGYSHVSADLVNDTEYVWRFVSEDGSFALVPSPLRKVRNRVWVKEAYSFDKNLNPIYRADGVSLDKGISWNSLSAMPKWASRIILEITEIQVEKVQEITEDDARAEGVEIGGDSMGRTRFRNEWDKIYKKKGFGWDANPWVWVISFRRVKP